VLEDRERYRMLRYLSVIPASLIVALLGRGTARVAIGAVGAGITLLLAVLGLGLDLDVATVDWPLLAVSTAVGPVAIVALGVAMAAVCLQTRQDSWSYPEAVAGALFLLVGAVFPLAVLPSAAQALGLLVPLTWWLEGTRRALFPDVPTAIGGPGSLWQELTSTSVPGTDVVVVALSLLSLASIVLAAGVYRWSEHRAKERGLLDQVTGS
jgi:ABC-2 type transport system permease protein